MIETLPRLLVLQACDQRIQQASHTLDTLQHSLAAVKEEEQVKVQAVRAWLAPRLSAPPEKRKSGWAGYILLTHNWQAKLGALAVVGVLWLVLVGPRNTEVGFTIPVVYHNIPEDLDLVGQHTQEVYLGVRGSRELLRFLNQDRLRAEIDLKEAREGTARYSLSAHEVNLPLGLQVAGVTPPTVTVHLKKKPLPKLSTDGNGATKEPSRP